MRRSWPRFCSIDFVLAGLLTLGCGPALAQLPAEKPATALSESAWTARPEQLRLLLLADAQHRLGLEVPQADQIRLNLDFAADQVLEFRAPAGALTRMNAGELLLAQSLELEIAGKTLVIAQPRLLPGQNSRIALRLVDAEDRVWLEFHNAHDSLDLESGALRLFNMGVVLGPALAERLGDLRLSGMAIAMGSLDAQVTRRPERLQPSSCANPNWPSPATPGDVALTGLGGYQVMRGMQADGPGGVDGQVVVAPGALLKNVGTRDMPWYGKFTGDFPPYGNDQHPFLVWSLYRMNAEGSLVQHARSGIKHAFLTINDQCTEECPAGNVLGLGCEDLYDAFTNDVPFDNTCPGYESCTLGPRSELIPASGIWARCGGIYDQNCDGWPTDTQPYGPFDHRMVAYETEFDPAVNPGSTQWFEGWYIVRDDANIYNSMGSTTVSPVYIQSSSVFTWNFIVNSGVFVQGPVLDRWLAASPAPLASTSATLATTEGQARLGVRVRQLPNGQYRYDYALMNFDFARAVLTGSNPDFRVLRAPGFSSLQLSAGSNALAGAGFLDGDRDPGNNWSASSAGGGLRWSAPAGGDVRWGSLVSFSLVSDSAPVSGSAELGVSEPGGPASFSLETLVPGTELFADGFELP